MDRAVRNLVRKTWRLISGFWELTGLCRGILYWDYIGIMENQMETSSMGII